MIRIYMFDFLRKLNPLAKQKTPKHLEEVDWKGFEDKLNIGIRNRVVFTRALRHSSMVSNLKENNIKETSNERLEFLGDAVLNLLMAEFLYNKYPNKPEGELTKMRSALVSRKMLAEKARQIDLGRFLILSNGEERNGGRQKTSILSNAMEAVVGAIYIDNGKDSTTNILFNNIFSDYEDILDREISKNYKGELLEYFQKYYKEVPFYRIRREEGPDHSKVYTMEVVFREKVVGVGRGHNKKIAEQKAAKEALKFINERKPV